MNLRAALIEQHPSLALQRAAAAEIARLDALVKQLTEQRDDARQTVNDWCNFNAYEETDERQGPGNA